MTVWALSCFIPTVTMFAFGLIGSARLFWLWTLLPLVETVIATVAGARVYRPGDRVVAAAAPART